MYICIYVVLTNVCIYTYIYIYMYRERDIYRERERDTYIYIYILYLNVLAQRVLGNGSVFWRRRELRRVRCAT